MRRASKIRRFVGKLHFGARHREMEYVPEGWSSRATKGWDEPSVSRVQLAGMGKLKKAMSGSGLWTDDLLAHHLYATFAYVVGVGGSFDGASFGARLGRRAG